MQPKQESGSRVRCTRGGAFVELRRTPCCGQHGARGVDAGNEERVVHRDCDRADACTCWWKSGGQMMFSFGHYKVRGTISDGFITADEIVHIGK